MTSPALAAALVSCTQDQILIESARRLGQDIKQENGVATAIEAIYRDLDYARSLIKHDTHLSNKEANASSSSPHPAGHEGNLSDGGSSGWDIVSERTSSARAMSDDEHDVACYPSPRRRSTHEDGTHVDSTSPLHRSTSNTIKRTLSRANSILPASLQARRRSCHSREVSD